MPNRKEGEVLKTAATNNVRLTMNIVRAGIRFNEKIGLGAGEDTQFFAEAQKQGYHIRYSDNPITYEYLHVDRLKYLAQCHRVFAESASVSRIRAYVVGDFLGIVRRLLIAPLMIVLGLCEIAVSLVIALLNTEMFKEVCLRGGRRIARALGIYAGFLNYVPKAYQRTVGG